MRCVSEKFMESLKNGNLQPVLERVRKDNTLMLAIRQNYINIYYRGGNILKITEEAGAYTCYFDSKYDLSEENEKYNSLMLPDKISTRDDTKKWVSGIPQLKELMDFWLNKNPKNEREFQQVVVRENNNSGISNETEYFITDIEIASSEISARFDMTAVKWPAGSRKSDDKCRPAFIEMKYGDSSLVGTAGLLKHLQDITAYLSEKKKYESAVDMVVNQFEQLYDLSLIKFNYTDKVKKVGLQLDSSKKPEFIFILANHNPRSNKLKSIIENDEISVYAKSDLFDLKFLCSTDAGYGMHDCNVIDYNEYLKRL